MKARISARLELLMPAAVRRPLPERTAWTGPAVLPGKTLPLREIFWLTGRLSQLWLKPFRNSRAGWLTVCWLLWRLLTEPVVIAGVSSQLLSWFIKKKGVMEG